MEGGWSAGLLALFMILDLSYAEQVWPATAALAAEEIAQINQPVQTNLCQTCQICVNQPVPKRQETFVPIL